MPDHPRVHSPTLISTRPRAAFVLCPSWHGATLLSVLLGNHSKIFALGDTIPPNRRFRCGCGEWGTDCPFWVEVVDAVGMSGGDALIPARPHLVSKDRLNQAAVGLQALSAWWLHSRPLGCRRFFEANARFIEVCQRQKDFDIFLDGYKSLIRYMTLKAERRWPIVGVIHVVRDPRAFIAAAKRSGLKVETACHHWVQGHRRIETVIRLMGERSILMRYEDFCADPEQQLSKILDWLDVPEEPLVRPIEPTRHWLGNMSVMKFDGKIKLWERWREELSNVELELIVRLTATEAQKRGYLI